MNSVSFMLVHRMLSMKMDCRAAPSSSSGFAEPTTGTHTR